MSRGRIAPTGEPGDPHHLKVVATSGFLDNVRSAPAVGVLEKGPITLSCGLVDDALGPTSVIALGLG